MRAAPASARRRVLAGLGSGLAVALLPLPASATPEAVRQAWRELFGERPLVEGGPLVLELPSLSESGNSVPVTLRWEGPMDEADRCVGLHLFSEGNPRPRIASYRLTPLMGRAQVRMRIRLARSQTIQAVAERSDGRLYAASAAIVVTQGACADDIWAG